MRIVYLSLGCFAASLFAQNPPEQTMAWSRKAKNDCLTSEPCETNPCKTDSCCDWIDHASPDIGLCNVPAAYNINAQIQPPCAWGPYLTASFIYWNVGQDYMDIGRTAAFTDPQPAVNATPAAEATIPTPSFEYQAGFKIGLGYNTNYDNWSVEALYTRLHHKNTFNTGSNQATFAEGDTIIIPNEWFVNLSVDTQQQAGRMTSKWTMDLDMADFLLSRPYYEGQMLTITPYMGLKALWMTQQYNISAVLADNPTLAPVTSNNDSKGWGVGPNFAANMHWLLGKGFRVEGNAALSLLYMQYTQREHREQFSEDITDTLPINGHMPDRGYLRAINELGLGLGWGAYFKDHYHFDLSARYDFTILWAQNAMRETVGYLANNAIGYSNPAGNLNLHGLTLTARFDF